MKRLIPIIIVILSSFIAKAQKIDTISFSLDNVELFTENGYTRIVMNSCMATGETGYPELPRLELCYILPYHRQISSILIMDSTKVLLANNVVVYPKQPDYPMDDTIQHEFVNPCIEVYDSNELYPSRIVEVSQQYYEKGFHIARVNVYPVCYTPNDNKIELYTNIRFQINYADNSPTLTRPKTQTWNMYNLTEKLIYNRIRNKNDFTLCEKGPLIIPPGRNTPAHQYISLLDMEYDVDPEYIIITNNHDINGNLIEDNDYPGVLMTDVFQELADWKTKTGVPTKVVTIDDISVNYHGDDTQEKIHNFLADVYDNYGTLYILLGGDTDIVPERIVYGHYITRDYLLPSDLYYVAIESGWNANCNSLYGEVEDLDLQQEIPQFYYGRASVENILEAKTFVDKSFKYENLTNIPPEQRDYVNNVVAMSSRILYQREIEKGLGRTIMEYDSNENITGQYDYGITQDYIEKWRLYEDSFDFINDDIDDDPHLVGNSWGWQNHNMVFSKDPALACFSSKIPLSSDENPKFGHFVLHIDHSSYLNMGTSSEIMHQSIDRFDVDGFLNAPFYQIVYTGGCYPGEYHKDCITEHFLNNPNGGAVAMFASSSTSNSDYLGFVGMLKDMYYFVEDNVSSSPYLYTLGTLHDNNLSKGGIIFTSDVSFLKRKHHLFGDPTIAVWTREPVDLTVSTTPSAITNQSGQLTVSVSGMAYSENATNDVDVCIMKDGEVYLREHYNGTAHSHVFVFNNIQPETAGTLKVTVTGHNYIPYETTIPVTITGKNVYISERSVEDNTGNNDGNLDTGETVNLSIALKNNGTVNLTNVTATLSCEFLDNTLNQNINNYLTAVTSIANYGSIAQNATVTKNDFQLTLSNAIPDRTPLRCTLTISDGNGSVSERSFTLPIGAPEIEYVSVRHEEKPNGRIGLDIELNNLGFGSAKGIAATLTSTSTGVQITQGTATYGNMSHLEAKTGSFEYIPTGGIEGKAFTLNVTDAYNKSWTFGFVLHDIVDTIENLAFTSTEHSIKLKWDPVENSRGYYVYRSSTANGDYERLNNYPIPSAVYPDMGLGTMQTYYYGVSYLDQNGNESEKARITAWTSLPVAEGWPVSIPDGLGRAWGTAPNVADVDGDGQQEIFLTTGTGDQFENLGAILGFNNQGEELFDIDHNPTTISGFANLHISMTCTPAIGDIDNDGIMEIVVATRGDENESNYKLYVYKNVDTDNDGAPDLAWEPKPLDFKNFNGVVLADLDDNGTLEIIAPNQGRDGSDGNTYTYLEVFDCWGEYYYPKSTIKVYDLCNHDRKAVTMPVVADFDKDGHKEIVFGLEGGVYMWGYSNQAPTPLVESNPGSNNPNDYKERMDCPVIAADIDSDGDLEILYMVIRNGIGYIRAINLNQSSVSGWNGDSHYITLKGNDPNWEWPPYFCVADIDNDGDIEVFAADNDTLKMWNSDGTAFGIGEIQIPNLDCRYFQPVITDVDGNGDCEIIVPSQNGYIYAYKSNGDAVPGWPLAVDDLATIPAITDIDGDGFNEVIAASQTELYVWHTEGESKYNQWDRFRYNKFNNAVYETPCSYDAVPLEITGTQIWNDDRRINRDIIINNGVQLTIKSEVRFSEDSKIVVKQGGRLILDGCKLTNSCPDEFWRGIEVWGNSSTHQATINGVCGQGFLELKNGAVIENAESAVELWKPGYDSTTGGIIHATDATFRNNARSVRALSYTNHNPYTNIENDYNAYFDNCSFIVDESYFGTETFRNHVVLSEINGIEFKGCDFVADRSAVGVDPTCTGLSAHSAGFSVTSPCTTNNTPCPETEIDRSTFTGLCSGIRITGIGSNPHTFVVRDAVFNNNDYGINVLNTQYPTIICNEFNIGGGGYCDFNYGVFLKNVTGFCIEENAFHPTPNATSTSIGVAICNSNSINNVYRNTFDGLSVANLALGQNTEISNGMSAGRLQGLTYTCNEFDGNGYDIMALKEEGVGNIQYQQGSSTTPAGNTFENSTFQIYNDGINQISYYYNPNGQNETPTNSMLYRVTPQTANGSNNCISHYGNNPVVKSPSEKAELASQYLSAYNAYSYLKRIYESHMDDSDTEDPTADNSPTAEMLQIGAQMAQYSHEYTLAAGDIVRSNLNDSVANPTELRTWLGNMHDIAADRMIISSYIQEEDSASAFALANMLPSKYELQGDQLTDHNGYMRLISLYQALHRTGRNIFQLTGTETNIVRDVAENGLGISQSMAEALMEQITVTDRGKDACFNPELPNRGDGFKGTIPHSSLNESKESGLNVSVAPNPATTWTTVNYALPRHGTKALLTLTNALGVNVLSMELEGTQGNKVLDLRSLAAGVYVYTIRYEQFTEIGKLVITK